MDLENRYGTLEIQRDLLVLLKEFDSFCANEGIRYSISSGTLLGAVRHKGFIPWDDDLDVNITRDEYNKLKLKINKSNRLQFINAEDTNLWISRIRISDEVGLAKEATLDLLILDNAPDEPFKDKIQLLKSMLFQGMIKKRPTVNKGSVLMRFCSVSSWLVGLPFSRRRKIRWYNKAAQHYNDRMTENKAVWMDEYNAIRCRYPHEVMDSIIRMPFEDTEVCGLAEYDRYLRIRYGDYMTPPKESERVPLHTKVNCRSSK